MIPPYISHRYSAISAFSENQNSHASCTFAARNRDYPIVTPVRCTFMRCTPVKCAPLKVQAHEVYAREVHAREVHA